MLWMSLMGAVGTFVFAVLLAHVEQSVSMMGSKVQQFASKPFIRNALKSPDSPTSVLSFFYGVDFSKEVEPLKSGQCIGDMMGLWYGGGPDYDALCEPMIDLVRKAGRKELPRDPWFTTVDGMIAQVLLCDQISRNVFRGMNEAFAYEEPSLDLVRRLSKSLLDGENCSDPLIGEFYPPYLSSMVVACMHSEDIKDHEAGEQLLDYAEANTPDLSGLWEDQRRFLIDHKEVVDRFGRYPHRNRAKDRTNTPSEEAWLSDTENLPGWAKSQM